MDDIVAALNQLVEELTTQADNLRYNLQLARTALAGVHVAMQVAEPSLAINRIDDAIAAYDTFMKEDR